MKERHDMGYFPEGKIKASYRNLHLEMTNLSRHAIYKTSIIKNNFFSARTVGSKYSNS